MLVLYIVLAQQLPSPMCVYVCVYVSMPVIMNKCMLVIFYGWFKIIPIIHTKPSSVLQYMLMGLCVCVCMYVCVY